MPDWVARISDESGMMTKWIDYAKNLAKRHVTFLVDPNSPDRIRDAIGNSPFGSLQGKDNEKYIFVLYEAKKSGESSARPHVRTIAALPKRKNPKYANAGIQTTNRNATKRQTRVKQN